MRPSNSPESKDKNLINLPVIPRTLNKQKNKEDSVKDELTPESVFEKFENLIREISNIFNGLFDIMPGIVEVQDFRITQTDENVIVNAKIPGLSTDNLDVNIGEDYKEIIC